MTMLHIHADTSGTTLSEYDEIQIQPNAIDLRLDRVYKILQHPFRLDENNKHHRGTVLLKPNSEDWWNLDPGTYEVVMQGTIKIGEGEAGWVITRSTLNRNGVFLTSGLYDSGYEGIMAGAMHVNVDTFSVKRGTRVGQFLLFKSDALHKYDGSYGLNSKHDIEKY